MKIVPTLLLLFSLLHPSISVVAVDFLFNGFYPGNLTLYGNATLDEVTHTLTLTDEAQFFSLGRALYPSKISTNNATNFSFYTSFLFAITPSGNSLSGHGIAFLLTPSPSPDPNSNIQNLGLFNGTTNGSPLNHVLAVEFDNFQNPEFLDPDDNHLGVDINSLTSTIAHAAGYYSSSGAFVPLDLNDGTNYQAWIDYSDPRLNVTMARAGDPRPVRPLISVALNLSGVLVDQMYVGFTAATGQLVQTHRILAWSFSHSNFSAHRALLTSNLPSFVRRENSSGRSKAFVAGVSTALAVLVACSSVLVYFLWRRRRRQRQVRRDAERDSMEEWELEYWPHRIRYRDISAATKEFAEENVIGIGGNGKVYKGALGAAGVQVAVKCIMQQQSEEGTKEFLAEISSLGRLKHRNLVGLLGWCKADRGSNSGRPRLMVVYEYMPNGSLDKRIFRDCRREMMLGWDARVRVLRDVATGLLYLHEGWEVRVLHRDIKAGNVMLDGDMRSRLGDFGLARMHAHGQSLGTTRLVGTVGYMAPELMRSGRASAKTDVYGFGVLVLEVACGRRPVEEGEPPLVEWVLGLEEAGRVAEAVDGRLAGEVGAEEAERVLRLGLLCAHPEAGARPSMRQVVKALERGGGGGGEVAEGEEELDAFLLGRVEPSSSKWLAKYQRWSTKRARAHPTFEDVKQSLSSSMSLSSSDFFVDGR